MKRIIRCYWFTFVVAKYYILFAVLPRLSGYSDVGCHKLQPTCRPAVSVGRQCVPAFSVGLAAVIALGIELSARLGPGAMVILPVRRYASAGTSYGPASVCLSVCPFVRLSQVGVLSKRMNESSCVFVRELLSTCPTLW